MKEIKYFFNNFAKTYEKNIFNYSLGTKCLSKIETDFVLKACPIKTNDKVLDIGIGTGRLSSLLSEKGAIINGIDISEKMIREVKKKLRGKKVSFKIADVRETIPYPNNTFDYVVCIRVLKYIPTWNKTIREVSRVLKKDGIFVLSIANKYSVACFGLKDTKYFLFKPSDVKKVLEENKFELINVAATSRLPFLLWQKINNNILLHILKTLEYLMSMIFPTTFLSRSVLIAAKKGDIK